MEVTCWHFPGIVRIRRSMNPEDIAGGIEAQLRAHGSSPPQEVHAPIPKPGIPNHELLHRIGGGSYGDIWLARSVTGQLRAVKVVWRQRFSSDRPYEREFHGIVQFEPISRSHPGVINILHVGRDDSVGCFFYVMELADNAGEAAILGSRSLILDGKNPSEDPDRLHPSTGVQNRVSSTQHPESYTPRTLAADLKARGRLPVADVLALGVQLADALGHLHRRGLVHRDVKPSNVIFIHGQAKPAMAFTRRMIMTTASVLPTSRPSLNRQRSTLDSLTSLTASTGFPT